MRMQEEGGMSVLSDRRQRVLAALIEEYVARALPVGSRTLTERYQLGVSPATVRNELSVLEDGGYIEFTDKRATAYNAYRRDAVIQLTKAGVDLVEGTREDPGVDV